MKIISLFFMVYLSFFNVRCMNNPDIIDGPPPGLGYDKNDCYTKDYEQYHMINNLFSIITKIV